MKYLNIIISLFFFLIGIGFAMIPSEMMYETTSIIAMLLLALPAFIGVIKWLGYKKGISIILLLGIFSLAIETIGLHTGFPYSEFTYGIPIGQKLFGTTPWTVFFAWSPFVIGAYAIAQKSSNKFLRLFISSLTILILFDLVLEPAAIARGLWSYTINGFWYSAPLSNYFGWLFSGSIAIALLHLFAKKQKQKETMLLASSLLLSTALWSGANLGFGFFVPGTLGIVLYTYLIKHALAEKNYSS